MLGICPDATLVDISHDIPPQDILAGALELDAVVRYFPHRTVFVAVVDPGVGSSRRAVAVDGNGRRFVGPDNGLFSLVLEDTPGVTSVELREAQICARPGQPNVRGARSIRAGCGLAGVGSRRLGTGTCGRRAGATASPPADRIGGRSRRSGASCRSLRQPGHEHRYAHALARRGRHHTRGRLGNQRRVRHVRGDARRERCARWWAARAGSRSR